MKWLNLIIPMSLVLVQNSISYAGFATSSSRIIYTEGERERSLILANINDYPIIAQTWVDDGQGNPDEANAPFVVLPAIFKMNPKGIQALRIVHNGAKISQDRESVFWLNLYEIPGKTKEQMEPLEPNQARLNLAMNTQLKVFYRPKSLPRMELRQIAEQLHFSLQQQEGQWLLICQNPTPYNVSFAGLTIVQGEQRVQVPQDMDMMIQALSQRAYLLPDDFNIIKPDRIIFLLIADDGKTYQSEFYYKSGGIKFDL
ncbi:fimbrial biogenesis chaperone [Acinetobacter dispersus]|uniref:fimbrial biogenesis chaperone n=1 Tax=Acinetobacter dispersus TaxID=70348 RepID=UPI001F4AB02D|nr:molecular chaperone [Acinetobacter dispersus]MCH7389036.1 molecular chaperone [Acinetobacter dispersus]